MLSHGARVTYADALAAADRMGHGLVTKGVSRLGVYLPNSPMLILTLLGAARVGCEVCVLGREYSRAEVEDLVDRFDFRHLLVESPLGIAGTTEILGAELELEGSPVVVDPPDSRVLILTTGTTGKPKAARYAWSALVAQIRRRPSEAGARWLLAYNLNHFGGMQMLLHALVNGATLIIPENLRPIDAVAAIEEFAVTHVSATPTFWRMVKAQIPVERLRALALEQVTLGAEAASEDLLAELREWFPSARIVHIFAATEVGSCFSVQDGRGGVPSSILERGEDSPVRFRIIDGELFVRSRHGMLGYHGESASAEDWRSTGDLVEQRGDRIYFVGRTSERINVGGVKVDPLPVEERVQRLDGVELARVYGKSNAITGQIVAVDVVASSSVDRAALEQRIRGACSDLPVQARPRYVRFVAQLDMRNTKLVRTAP